MKGRGHRCVLLTHDGGQVTAFVVIIMLALLLCAGLVVDGGLALAAKARAMGEAQQAARAGAQQIDLGALRATGTIRLLPDRASAAARTALAATKDTGTANASPDAVTVTVRATEHTQLLSLIGINTLTVTASATAHAQRGIVTPDQFGGTS